MNKTHLYDMRGVLVDFPNDQSTVDKQYNNIWTQYNNLKKQAKNHPEIKSEVKRVKQQVIDAFNESVQKGLIKSVPVAGIEAILNDDQKKNIHSSVFSSDDHILSYALRNSNLEKYISQQFLSSHYGLKEESDSHLRVLQAIIKQGSMPARYIEDGDEKFFPHLDAVLHLDKEIQNQYLAILFSKNAANEERLYKNKIPYFIVNELKEVQHIKR